jgi:antitoxin component of RelBE/YafQ-DinJ toxin-antitoxin module
MSEGSRTAGSSLTGAGGLSVIVRKAVFNRFLKRLSQTERFPVEDLGLEPEADQEMVSATTVSDDLERGMNRTDSIGDSDLKNA